MCEVVPSCGRFRRSILILVRWRRCNRTLEIKRPHHMVLSCLRAYPGGVLGPPTSVRGGASKADVPPVSPAAFFCSDARGIPTMLVVPVCVAI